MIGDFERVLLLYKGRIVVKFGILVVLFDFIIDCIKFGKFVDL